MIAVMMRYPEMSSVQYQPEDGTLTMVFILRRSLSDEEWGSWAPATCELLETYRHLTGTPPTVLELRRTSVDHSTMIELVRDVKTVSVEEAGMMIEILRDQFGPDLVADPHELLEEEMIVQEENIQANLEALKKGASGQLVALRDDGRVMVYKT